MTIFKSQKTNSFCNFSGLVLIFSLAFGLSKAEAHTPTGTSKECKTDLDQTLQSSGVLNGGRLGQMRLGVSAANAVEASQSNVNSQTKSIERFLGKDQVVDAPKEAFEPRIEKLPASVESILSLARENPNFSSRLNRMLPADPTQREILVAALQDDDLRRIIAEASLSHLKRRASGAQILGTADAPAYPEAFDIVFIGAGIHEANMQSAIRQMAPDLRVLTVEQSDTVASTFSAGGVAFNINSSSRAENPAHLRQALGDGDLNFLPGGAVQVSQFDNARNPVAQSLAQAAVINRALSQNDVLFSTPTEGIEIVIGSEIKTIKLAGGRNIQARKVVYTGLGTKNRNMIPGLENLFARDKQLSKTRVVNFFEFFKLVNEAQTPMELFSGKRIGVAGPGDSGKAVVRWLLGNANPASYGQNGRRVSGPSKILWYGQPAKDCRDFVEANRGFYFDIASGYRSKILEPKPKIDVVRDLGEGNLSVGLTDVEGQADEVDFLIVTTGIENDLAKLMQTVFGYKDFSRLKNIQDDPRYFSPVQGYEPTLGNVTYAKEAVYAERSLGIYLVGPAAGKIALPDELRAIEENTVAMANHSWRVWRMAEALVKEIRADKARRAAAAGTNLPEGGAPKAIEKLVLDTSNNPQSASKIFGVSTQPLTAKESVVQLGDDMALMAALGDLVTRHFQVSVVPPSKGTQFKVVFAKQPGESAFLVQFQPALRDRQAAKLASLIANDVAIPKQVQKWLQANQEALVVDLEFNASAQLVPSGCRLNGQISTKALLASTTEKAVFKSGTSFSSEQMGALRSLLEVERGTSNNYGAKELSGQENIATKYFGGDMAATFDAAVQIYGLDVVTGRFKWRRLTLNAGQSSVLREALDDETGTSFNNGSKELSGLEKLATRVFGGDMAATFDAAAQIYVPDAVTNLFKWKRLTLNAGKSSQLRKALDDEIGTSFNNGSKEISGLEQLATKVFGGDMAATYDAALQIYGIDVVTNRFKWKRLTLNAVQSSKLRQALDDEIGTSFNNGSKEISGLEKLSTRVFGGDMAATYDAAAQIYEPNTVINRFKWKRLTLNAGQSSQLRQALDDEIGTSFNNGAKELSGLENLASKVFGGDMAATYDAAAQIYEPNTVINRFKWKRLTLKAGQSSQMRQALDDEIGTSRNNGAKELSGLEKLSTRVFGGDMAATFEAAVQIYGEDVVLNRFKWKRFD